MSSEVTEKVTEKVKSLISQASIETRFAKIYYDNATEIYNNVMERFNINLTEKNEIVEHMELIKYDLNRILLKHRDTLNEIVLICNKANFNIMDNKYESFVINKMNDFIGIVSKMYNDLILLITNIKKHLEM
jgi:hypothetical protein